METEADDLSFSSFRFKSFRTHKLIEEDYSLLQVDEPEEVPMIVTKDIVSDERLSKDGIELVAIDEKQLKVREREEQKRQRDEDQDRYNQMKKDIVFIDKKEKDTSKYLETRQNELKKFLDKK